MVNKRASTESLSLLDFRNFLLLRTYGRHTYCDVSVAVSPAETKVILNLTSQDKIKLLISIAVVPVWLMWFGVSAVLCE